MPQPITLIVGLGNPGAEYENTRHNAGAWFIHLLAAQAKVSLRYEKKFQALHATTKLFQHDCHLLIPTTFMNLSGHAVQAMTSFYKISPPNILVAHDEIDLEVGDIRIKFDGGHGGHNGLRDMIISLGTNQFHRLRIGVGHPGHSSEVVNYVLHHPNKADKEQIDAAMQEALHVMPLLLEGQIQKAMHQLHSKS